MLERGPRRPAPADAPESLRRRGVPDIAETDPVFYRRPIDTIDANGYLVHRQVRPVTAKHIETLFTRIKQHLPWAKRRGLRPHDLRHTSARIVYHAADEQMARLHLAHDASSTTDHYLTEATQAGLVSVGGWRPIALDYVVEEGVGHAVRITMSTGSGATRTA